MLAGRKAESHRLPRIHSWEPSREGGNMNQKEYDPDDIINGPGKWEPLTGKDAYKALKDAGFYKNGPRFSLANLSFDEYLQKLRAEYPASRDARIELLKVQRRGCLRQKETLTDSIGAEYPDDLKSLNGLIRGLEAELRFYGCSPSEWDNLQQEAPQESLAVQQRRQEGAQDELRAADEMMDRFFTWKRFLPLLIQDGVITPIDDLYRLCPRVRMPRRYFAMFLYQIARANARDKDGITKEARKIAWTFFKNIQGKDFSSKFYDQEFTPPPPVDKITNETAKKIINTSIL